MTNGELYHELLMEMYRDYEPTRIPMWVLDGLIEEGFAEQNEGGRLHLTDDGMALSDRVGPTPGPVEEAEPKEASVATN